MARPILKTKQEVLRYVRSAKCAAVDGQYVVRSRYEWGVGGVIASGLTKEAAWQRAVERIRAYRIVNSY